MLVIVQCCSVRELVDLTRSRHDANFHEGIYGSEFEIKQAGSRLALHRIVWEAL